MASKKLQNFENVHVVSRTLDHGHGRPYTWGHLYKHVSHKNDGRSSEKLTLFYGKCYGCAGSTDVWFGYVTFDAKLFQILNFVLIYISLTRLIIVLIKVGYLC